MIVDINNLTPKERTPLKLGQCVRCHSPILKGDEYYSLWEGIMCYDCAFDYLRENHCCGEDFL